MTLPPGMRKILGTSRAITRITADLNLWFGGEDSGLCSPLASSAPFAPFAPSPPDPPALAASRTPSQRRAADKGSDRVTPRHDTYRNRLQLWRG